MVVLGVSFIMYLANVGSLSEYFSGIGVMSFLLTLTYRLNDGTLVV